MDRYRTMYSDDKQNYILMEKSSIVDDEIITQVTFEGRNNIVFLEDKVKLKNSNIVFRGNSSVVYLSSSFHPYYLNATLYNDSVFYMGKNNYINGKINVILSEQKHIVIGNDGLFSFGIWIRLADPHLVYDVETKKRQNASRSVIIGDHVWIGQGAMILKGTTIGSGAIIGAMAVVSGKRIASNTIWGGNPARLIKEKVFFSKECVHQYKREETLKSMIYEGEEFIFKRDGKSIEGIDEALTQKESAIDRLEYLREEIDKNKNKNRFFIGKDNVYEKKKCVFGSWLKSINKVE